MILKYAIALAILIALAAVLAWAFPPPRHLPGNRARHLRLRLHQQAGHRHAHPSRPGPRLANPRSPPWPATTPRPRRLLSSSRPP